MGPQEDFVETVFTCEGDINDPDLKNRLEDFRSTLKDLLSTGKADDKKKINHILNFLHQKRCRRYIVLVLIIEHDL